MLVTLCLGTRASSYMHIKTGKDHFLFLCYSKELLLMSLLKIENNQTKEKEYIKEKEERRE